MRVLEIKVMRGPNIWSNYRQHLIVMKLDLEELETRPTHRIDGFADRIKKMMPSLYSHRCSEDRKGGFFERVEQGTWMGHVIEHIALEIQSLAGMHVGYGRTRSTERTGVYHVVFAYRVEEAGRYAAKAAIRIAEALIKGEDYDIEDDIFYLKRIARRDKLGPSTAAIVEEAKAAGIPYKRLYHSLIIFGYGNKQKKLRATVAGTTRGIGIEIAKDKQETKTLLDREHIPTPQGELAYNEDDVLDLCQELKYPLVIKPVDGNHGRGITTNIQSTEQALAAFRIAREVSRPVIIEEFVEGDDYRLVLVNYKLVAAAKRTPAMVTGNGVSTIAELIDQVNSDPSRGDHHENVLTRIIVDEVISEILAEKKLSLNSILQDGEQLLLKHTANISTGGTAEDVTDLVHPYNIFLAERISQIVDLDICGIDIIAKDLSKPLTRDNGAIIEVNAGPGLRMHHSPYKGFARNIAKPIIQMLFPGKEQGRIPIVAVTGTNGKTTTTRMIAHIAQFAGKKTGFTTTDGIFIQGHNIYTGDCTGPKSAETVLFDPTIEFAVLECARGGILRSGLAFDTCDISVVTNISEDHLGLGDIHSVKDMARVKEVVPRTTKEDGYAILNADDDLVYDMRKNLDCRIALFSMDPGNERLTDHCADGGIGATIEGGYLTICDGKWKERIGQVTEFPVTLNGRAESMIKNLLPAALAAVLSGLSKETIHNALLGFLPSETQSPGRMNIFKFRDFELMIDYAHNTAGFAELKKFLSKTQARLKVGVIAASGDRRDSDIREVGKLAAEMFDEIIIRQDEDLRGRTADELSELLMEGIQQVNKNIPVKVIPDEITAIQYCLDHARKGEFITVCTDKISKTISFLTDQLKKEKQQNMSIH